MRKSKLEVYHEILRNLNGKSLSLDYLSYKTGMSCTFLKQRLDFLLENDLVKEKVLKRTTHFVVSARGRAVLKALNVEERLEQVKSAIIAVNDALQAKIAVAERQHKTE